MRGISMSSKKPKVIAIIPARNEERTIGRVLAETKRFVDEIIVIDDASRDQTRGVSSKYAMVLSNTKNLGYDKSIGKGVEEALRKGADIIVTLDADGQHFPSDIFRLIQPILSGKAKVACGQRPYPARFMEKVFSSYGIKKGINDPLCGMKAYAAPLIRSIGFFDTISSVGTQLCFAAAKRNFGIANIPIQLQKRADTPRFGRKIKANLKLFFAYLRLKKYLNSMPKE